MSYSTSAPVPDSDDIFNLMGASFDAANIGGSGVNADGGEDNGLANDAFTYVANNQPRQGQSLATGSNPNGYKLNAVCVQMAGYSNNIAISANGSAWNLNPSDGPIMVVLKELSGVEAKYVTVPLFNAGGLGNPGNGASANGVGMWISFEMPFTTILKPDTTYCFELVIGNGSDNYFEWLGTSQDVFAGGTAYNPSGSGIVELTGDRVFALDIDVLQKPEGSFDHPSTLPSKV